MILTTSKTFMTLGQKIKKARMQKKLSQSELAEAADVYQKNVSRYEQDTTVPSATALKKIADVLGVTTDYLLSERDEEIAIKDKDLMKQFEELQNLTGETKNVVLTFLDLVIRDAKTRRVYGR